MLIIATRGKPIVIRRTVKRLTKALAGRRALFHGYDGKEYDCTIMSVFRGTATIHYYVPGRPEIVTGYTSDPARLELETHG
jgi:hypothetical protein